MFYINIMMKRRFNIYFKTDTYDEIAIIENETIDKKKIILYKLKTKYIIIFISLDVADKLTINRIKQYCSIVENKNKTYDINICEIIIVHDAGITPDAKKKIINSSVYFNIFTFADFSFDKLYIIFEDMERNQYNIRDYIKIYTDIYKNIKVSYMLQSDPISKYFNFQKNDIIFFKLKEDDFILKQII
jgi:hypothetical protein